MGPGIVLAGTSIGSGEWLFGPALTAQYGATLLWLARSASVPGVLQPDDDALHGLLGEPIIVGGLRTWPGPGVLGRVLRPVDIASIWPFNASNAAVPLAAVVLGRLPDGRRSSAGQGLGFGVFLLASFP